MQVCVIGAGYVGLVTGACLADQGHDVVCVDRDEARVAAIRGGTPLIHEPGLPEVLERTVGRRLQATTDLAAAVRASEISLLCVGTPFDGRTIDLTMVEQASHDIGTALRGRDRWHTVVIRSTVVPGTTDGLVRRVLEGSSGGKAGRDFGLAMNPEFLTEGTALADFRQPDRIVIGALDQRSRHAVAALYAAIPMVVPRLHVNLRTAELIKYASNALLATAISFANEIADLCEAVGEVDVVDVMRGVHLSRYLTAHEPHREGWTAPLASFLEAGCGYGGSCLPKDVKSLVAHGLATGVPMRLLQAVDAINRERSDRVLDLVEAHLDSVAGLEVTVLGLSFKPDTDDIRETPARPVIEGLLRRGARVTVHDPVAGPLAARVFGTGGVRVAASLEDAVERAAAVVLITRWPEYERLPELVARRDPPPLIVDGRRMLDPGRLARYAGIGRST